MSAKPKPPTKRPDPNDLRGVLAYNIRALRLDRTYVSAVERSRWNVSLSNIDAFAHALVVEPWQLLKPLDPAGVR